MRKIRTAPAEVWSEYEHLKTYNNHIELYETVKQNENFFIGKQWEGVNAPDLDKPVVNILKRVVAYFLSNIVSDDVSARVTVGNDDDLVGTTITQTISQVIENTKMKAKNRDMLRNSAVDGDGCFYINFDPEAGQQADENRVGGDIDIELIDNTNILFGNPQVCDVQKQPYIIISMRKMLDDVKDEAEGNGLPTDAITPDNTDAQILGSDYEDTNKITVLLKLWKQNGTIHAVKTTQGATIKEDTDLGLKLYPVAWMPWEKVKNSYHGQAAITGLIPNQIFINKLFAMGMEHVKKTAFPKVVFDQSLLPDGWNNRVGEAIPVQGDPNVAVMSATLVPDMSNQVMVMLDKVIDYTRDTMGASDAALGNIRPDNTSAIIAVQKASAMPLELQRMSFYQFVEDVVRILIDVMRVNFGVRQIVVDDENGNKSLVDFDFANIGNLELQLNVDVGASTYWSELMNVQTADNLYTKGIIPDPITYLEIMPDGYVPKKQKLISKWEQSQMQQEMLAQMQAEQQIGGMPDAALPQMPNGA